MQSALQSVSVNPVFFDKETVDAALDDMKLDVEEYPREAIYKAVYSAKITSVQTCVTPPGSHLNFHVDHQK